MAQVPEWKIFYDNRKPFSSEDGLPEDASLHGVLLIVQKGQQIKEGEHILNGGDCYRFVDKWYQGTELDLLDPGRWLKDNYPILMGRLTDQKTWRQAKQEAIEYAKL